MKRLGISLLVCAGLIFSACSTMIEDLNNVNKGTAYTVKHLLEQVAEYDDDGNQINLDNGNIVFEELENFVETKYGKPGELTKAEEKHIPGFLPAEDFEQAEIAEDGTTEIRIYYKRKSAQITVKLNDDSITEDADKAMWNYTVWKKDKANVSPDYSDKLPYSGKFGSKLKAITDLATAGKAGCGVEKWKMIKEQNPEAVTYVSTLPETIGEENVTYIAVWKEMDLVDYKVYHWFEKTGAGVDSSKEDEANYERNESLTETKKGRPETMTAAEKKIVDGFTGHEINQQEISASGATVVNVYYSRNSIDVTFDPDDGVWNYDKYKSGEEAAADTGKKTISGKYGTEIDYSSIDDFETLKKIGKTIKGFAMVGGNGTAVAKPSVFPAKNCEYKVFWQDKKPVTYEVQHLFENLNITDDALEENYTLDPDKSDKTKTAVPDYETEAVPIDIPGFTAITPVNQVVITDDGKAVVKIFYKRNSYKITLSSNGGMWNYAAYKAGQKNGPHVDADSANIEIEAKYEAVIDYSTYEEKINALGRTSYDFLGWKKNDRTYAGTEFDSLPETVPADNVTYYAMWQLGEGVPYTVKHCFEKLGANSVYEEDESLRETGHGVKEELTEATPLSIPGFTAMLPFAQQEIKEDGSTVVQINYSRNNYIFNFDADGGVISGNSSVEGKYGSNFDPSNTPTVTKAGWTFAGWMYNGQLIEDSKNGLKNQSYDLTEDKTFTACWISTVTVGTLSMFGNITMTKTQSATDVRFTVELPAGYESENWTYKWYVDGVYTYDRPEFIRQLSVLGKGKHTITLQLKLNNSITYTANATVF